ncbi:hypothetical protein NLG97_g1516 [Lecanicillium saksenae]|uniref:Uncharacterized protein n=1 Tax=Lecanicillium saksenae TaxID=468837 RepID=A0ACC1R4Z1_9HYPO|nr:hypothetical protein NLG97_g1516 [Lecanicillium saksenae]
MQSTTNTETLDLGAPSAADVPSLDYDSATLSTSSPDTIQSMPSANFGAGLNPQAPWFDLGGSGSLDAALLCGSPPPPQGFFGGFGSPPPPMHFGEFSSPPPPGPPFPNTGLHCSGFAGGSATTDDLKLLLLAVAARLDAIERAVATASVQWGRVERDVSDLKERPSAEAAVDSLKKSVKEFTSALVLQVLGGEVPVEDTTFAAMAHIRNPLARTLGRNRLSYDCTLAPKPLAIPANAQGRPTLHAPELQQQNTKLQRLVARQELEIKTLKKRIEQMEVYTEQQTGAITDVLRTTSLAFKRYRDITGQRPQQVPAPGATPSAMTCQTHND